MLIRKEHVPRPVSENDVSDYIERELEDIEDEADRRQTRDSYEEMPIPEAMPAFADVMVDDVGNLWIQEFNPDEDAESVWSVFTSGGQLLGPVTLAPGLEVNQIGDDFVLGMWHDEFDVEHVLLYGLIKPEQ
jgi:hypothetical protein